MMIVMNIRMKIIKEVSIIKKQKLNIPLLKKIIRMDKFELYDFLNFELSKYYAEIDTDKTFNRYIFCKGVEPVLLIAHLDTVFEPINSIYTTSSTYEESWLPYQTTSNPKDKEIFHDRVEQVMWSPDGLGADDRVGVFMILSLVQAGLKPSILFTTDEETGSNSGGIFATKYLKIFNTFNIKYIMELDRSGYNDCVFYQSDNPKFEEYIQRFGFVKARGSFTDISVICPILKVAGVNLSVGYFNEHSLTEMIDLFTMSENYDIIYYMVEKSRKIKKPYKHIPIKVKVKSLSIKQSESEFIIGDEIDRLENCSICSIPMGDYVLAKDFGKICLECYLELELDAETEM